MDKSKWEYKKLGEVAKFIGGGTPSKANEDYYTGNIPWATVRDMANFNLSKTELCITDLAVKESATNIVPKDTIVISTHVGLGKICLLMQDTAINQDLKGVILPQSVDKMFFAAWYKSIADYVISNGKGATVKGVTMKFVNDLKIPVPPISDQQRIVAELDCLNEMIALKQEQLKEFDKLAQSIFYDMFGDPITNEKGWILKSMKDVCRAIGDGLHGTPQYDDNGTVAFINGNNLVDGKIVITERTQFVNEIEAKKIFIELDTNTVLLSINGTLGKTAVYNNEKVVLGKSACYLRLSKILDVNFVMALMNTNEYMGYLENNSSKSTIKNVGLKAIRNFPIILPPLALQQQFAEKIQAIEAQKELVKQSIAETQSLLDYTMDKYFG